MLGQVVDTLVGVDPHPKGQILLALGSRSRPPARGEGRAGGRPSRRVAHDLHLNDRVQLPDATHGARTPPSPAPAPTVVRAEIRPSRPSVSGVEEELAGHVHLGRLIKDVTVNIRATVGPEQPQPGTCSIRITRGHRKASRSGSEIGDRR